MFKILTNILQFLSFYSSRGLKKPVMVQISPSIICNLKCKICLTYIESDKEFSETLKYDLEYEHYDKLLRQLKNMGTEEIIITGGGEPLLKSYTLKIMELIKKLNMRGSLITNGALLSGEIIQKMVEIKWDFIRISLDAPNSEVYLNLKGKDLFNRVKSNILSINKYKKECNTSKPFVGISYVLQKPNFNYIDKLVDLALEVSVDCLIFVALIPSKNNFDLAVKGEDAKRCTALLRNASERIRGSGLKTNMATFLQYDNPSYYNFKEKKICFVPWLAPFIQHNGDVYPCCHSNEIVGNIKNQHFGKIWDSRNFRNFRKRIQKKQFPNYCKKCPHPFELELILDRCLRAPFSNLRTIFLSQAVISACPIISTIEKYKYTNLKS